MTPISQNLVELGHFCAHVALALALVQGLAPLAARAFNQPRLAAMSVNAAIAVFVLTTLGGATLIHAFVISNFSVEYVTQHSNLALPMFYKVSALWGGHEGSLYLWAWVLTLYTLFVAWHGRKRYPAHVPPILAVQGWLVVGFFGLILFLSNPFTRLFPVPADGHDLNPLLQDPGMVIHPPMLYLGYVGFSVPFAFAMAALLTNWKSELWVGLIRRWTLIGWGFLTTGIMLGGWWAYYELGWGGYWAWDPVENASFMPWLLGTALVHSITVQERRQMLHTWNIFLVISTFALSLLGTFLVRSGVLNSVHAFAVDPGRGMYILVFMFVVLTLAFGLFIVKGRYQEAQESISSGLSREAMFVANNVVFTLACLCVMLGTLAPLAWEALTHGKEKITIGPDFFNIVMVPIFLIVLLLMALGPTVPWRKVNPQRLRQRLLWPAVAGMLGAVLMAVFARPWHWTAPVAVGLVASAVTVVVFDYLRAVRQRLAQVGGGVLRAMGKTVLANRRHWGGMVVHIGIAVVALGLVGSGLFYSEKTVVMAPGDTLEVGGETLRYDGVRDIKRHNYVGVQGQVTLLDSGRTILPEKRWYPRQAEPMTDASLDSTLWRDVYVVIADSGEGVRRGVHVWVNPLVQFIWGGGFIMIFGLLLNLSGRRTRSAGEAAARSGA